MTTREQIIAAAQEAGISYSGTMPEIFDSQDILAKFYAIAFGAGAASQAMAIAAKDAEIAELVAALKGFVNYPADDADYPPPYKAAHEAIAKVRKPT